LVLALARPTWQWVLLDASARRTSFLERAVELLGLEDRVEVHTGRAEDLGRLPGHRASYQLVVARSFARPAVVAECAAPLLAVGGRLVVSEPPTGQDRWPDQGLDVLGLGRAAPSAASRRLVILRQERRCPERYPRRVGIPSKRPLW
jgi:16S rRNA (guanine527-N7)-methyltransferase